LTRDLLRSTHPANRQTLCHYYHHDGDNVLCEYLYQTGGLTATRQYVNGPTYIDEQVVLRDLKSTGQDRYYPSKNSSLTAAPPKGCREMRN
jgi:hypothetical protein